MKFMTIALILFITSSALAAQFSPTLMTSAAAKKLAAAASTVARNKEVFGDVGMVKAFNFVRKAGEADVNTLSQLNHMKGGLNSDDRGAINMQRRSARDLATHLLDFNSQYDDENAYVRALNSLTDAIEAVKADRNLVIYGTNHADEDGTWQILNVLDVRNKQILFIKLGYSGT